MCNMNQLSLENLVRYTVICFIACQERNVSIILFGLYISIVLVDNSP